MTTYGSIINVSTNNVAETVLGGVSVGAFAINLADVTSFSDEGGQFVISGSNEVFEYIGIDVNSNSLLLDDDFPYALDDGTVLEVYPPSSIKTALISFGDEESEAISVVIPHNQKITLEDGFREEDSREMAILEERTTGDFYIRDIVAQQATVIPEAIAEDITDGMAPATSPTPTVLSGFKALGVRWTPINNQSTVTYDVHISTDPNFTPSESTLSTSVGVVNSSFSTTIRALPDNSELQYGVIYYVRVVARDADGSAPASNAVANVIAQITTADVSANYIYSNNIYADQIIGGTIQSDVLLSGNIKTATAGARVELGPFGLIAYGSNGAANVVVGSDGNANIKGIATLTNLTVTDGMTIRNTKNEFSRGSVTTLANGTTAPGNAPSALSDYETYTLKNPDGSLLTGSSPVSVSRTGTLLNVHCSDNITRRFNADGTFNSNIGRSNIAKSSWTQISADTPGYFTTSTGYIYRDQDIDSINGQRYQLKDDFSGALTTNWNTQGPVALSGGKAVFSPVQSPSATVPKLTSKNTFNLQGHVITFDLTTNAITSSDGSNITIPSNQFFDMYLTMDANNYVRVGVCSDSEAGGYIGTGIRTEIYSNGTKVYSSIYSSGLEDYTTVRFVETAGIFYIQSLVNSDGSIATFDQYTHPFSKAQLASTTLSFSATDNSDNGNVVLNPEFDTDLSYWTAKTNCTITRSTATDRQNSGAGSLRLNATADGRVGARTPVPVSTTNGGDSLRVSSKQPITVSFYGRTATGLREMYVYMTTYSHDTTGSVTDKTSYQASGQTFADNNGFTKKTVTFNVPSAADSNFTSYASFEFGFLGGFNGDVNYIDTVHIDFPPVTFNVDNVGLAWSSERNLITRTNTGATPVIGNNGVNLLTAEVTTDKKVIVREVDPGDMRNVLNTYTSAVVPSIVGPLKAVLTGTFDFGVNRYIVKDTGNGDFYSFTQAGNVLTAQPNENFPADTGGSAGAIWDGSVFQSLGTNAVMYKRTMITWNDAGSYKNMASAYSWYDGDSAGTGMHETQVSPSYIFNMAKRSRLTITGGTIPDQGGFDDPDRIRIYVANGSAATLYSQTITPEGINSAVLSSLTFSGMTPLAANNFPDSAPAVLKNPDSSLVVSADGSILSTNITATAMPIGRYARNAAQAITAGSSQVVQLNVQSQLVNMTWDATNFRFVITQAGRYVLNGTVCYQGTSSGTGRIEASVRVNGVDTALRTTTLTTTGSAFTSANCVIYRDLVVGDTIALSTFSSIALNTHTNAAATFLEVVRLY